MGRLPFGLLVVPHPSFRPKAENPPSPRGRLTLRVVFAADRCFYAKEYFAVIKRKSTVLCGFLKIFCFFAKIFLFILCILFQYRKNILHKPPLFLIIIYIFVQDAQILPSIFVSFLIWWVLILQDLLRYNVLDERTVRE